MFFIKPKLKNPTLYNSLFYSDEVEPVLLIKICNRYHMVLFPIEKSNHYIIKSIYFNNKITLNS